jgi:hypothetical protein
VAGATGVNKDANEQIEKAQHRRGRISAGFLSRQKLDANRARSIWVRDPDRLLPPYTPLPTRPPMTTRRRRGSSKRLRLTDEKRGEPRRRFCSRREKLESRREEPNSIQAIAQITAECSVFAKGAPNLNFLVVQRRQRPPVMSRAGAIRSALRWRHPRQRAGRGPGAHVSNTNAQGIRPDEAGDGGKSRDRGDKKHGVLRKSQ